MPQVKQGVFGTASDEQRVPEKSESNQESIPYQPSLDERVVYLEASVSRIKEFLLQHYNINL